MKDYFHCFTTDVCQQKIRVKYILQNYFSYKICKRYRKNRITIFDKEKELTRCTITNPVDYECFVSNCTKRSYARHTGKIIFKTF